MQITQENNVFELRPLAKEIPACLKKAVSELPTTQHIKIMVELKIINMAA